MTVSWPGVIAKGTTCHVPVTSMDFFPTFVHAAGGSTEQIPELEGRDLKPVFTGQTLDRESLFWHYPHNRPDVKYFMGSVILQGPWKYYQGHGTIKDALFNLADDPLEKHNLINNKPEQVKAMQSRLESWLNEVGAKMPPKN